MANGHVFAAAITGGVHAIDLQTGKKVWTWEPQKEKKKAKLRLSGGPGVGENLVVIGTLDGQSSRWTSTTAAKVARPCSG